MCKESVNFSLKKVAYLPSPLPAGRPGQPSPLKGEGVFGGGEKGYLEKGEGAFRKGEGIELEKKKRCPEEHHPDHTEDQSHHSHDDHEQKAHGHDHQEISSHSHQEHQHHLHDDVVSLAHRHHDHQHLPLMHNQASARAHSCHAGDGHNHGESQPGITAVGGMPVMRPVGGGNSHHHHEGEHEHCPNCDEHLVDHDCPKCGYHHE